MTKVQIIPLGGIGELEISRMLELELSDHGITAVYDSENGIGARIYVCSALTSELKENILDDGMPTVLIYFSADEELPENTLNIKRPFDPHKLCQRLSAFLQKDEDKNSLSDTPWIKDGSAYYGNEQLNLSKTELSLLSILLNSKGTPVTKDELRSVFKDAPEGNAVEVYINYLRRKIDARFGKSIIMTVRNKGYMIK